MYFLDGCPKNLGPIVDVVHDFYNILLIVIPIILLVIGTVDLAKAVMAGDEKEIKGATGMLAKRAGAAVVVFILGLVINLVLGLVPNSGGWVACWGNPVPTTGNNVESEECPSGADVFNSTCYDPNSKRSVCASGYTFTSGNPPKCTYKNSDYSPYIVTDSLCGASTVRIDGYCYDIME